MEILRIDPVLVVTIFAVAPEPPPPVLGLGEGLSPSPPKLPSAEIMPPEFIVIIPVAIIINTPPIPFCPAVARAVAPVKFPVPERSPGAPPGFPAPPPPPPELS